jgi:hypothetical protein
VRRFNTTFKILLVAVVMLSAAGTPVIARPVVSGNHARIERVQKKQQTSFFLSWIKNWRSKLSRYAMAAS